MSRQALVTPPRRDGWTARRQLRFLNVLTHTGSVTLAARCVGMTRESAYRLRARDPHGLFAHIWATAMCSPGHPHRTEIDEGHRLRATMTRLTEGEGPAANPATTSSS